MESKPRILAVFAHPDDETYACGGTLAKYARQGAEITLICATRGEAGRRMGHPPFTTRKELPRVREQELRNACNILGIGDLLFLDLPDKGVERYEPEPLTRRLVQAIRLIRPQIMITFGGAGGFAYHADHRAIHRCATAAFRAAGDPEAYSEAEVGKPHRVHRLYYPVLAHEIYNPSRLGIGSDRITRVDISETWDIKIQALQAHLTQFQQDEWLWDEQTARQHIAQEEGFIQASGEARPNEVVLIF
ncbi:MAG: PIG-L family deacetylase [Bacillaceae bacterium]|nr:PIG-L family deacetylase [Bacillaceae bacterium]